MNYRPFVLPIFRNNHKLRVQAELSDHIARFAATHSGVRHGDFPISVT